MMKLRGKLTLISLLGVGSIVATGFAAFTFSNNKEVKQTISNVKVVTGATEEDNGTIALDPANWYLIIDQDFLGWSKTKKEGEDVTYTAEDKLDSVTATFTPNEDLKLTMDQFDLKYSMAVDDSLKQYISIAPWSGTWESGKSITLPEVNWVDGKEPASKSEYDAMIKSIGDVTFVFTANVKSATPAAK